MDDGLHGGLKTEEHCKSVRKHESRTALHERVATLSIPLAAVCARGVYL